MNILDNRVVDIETKECGENLIDVPHSHEKLSLDEGVELGYENEFVAREIVVSKLIEAANYLPNGLLLSVKETYRPLGFQQEIFNRRVEKLRASGIYKHLSKTDIFELTSQFIAPPHVAGHPTGGAVDVSLIDEMGNELDMGCAYDEDEENSSGKCFSFCSNLNRNVQSNRAILFSCMEKAGFINYPFEWWHWSYGDKYWAAVTGAPNALYSAISKK